VAAGFRKSSLCISSVVVAVTEAQRRLVERLHRLGSPTAAELADDLGLTPAAVRLHLDRLSELGFVVAEDPVPAGGRGRPAQRWRLTELARRLFPDRHADLAVELLGLVHDELGPEALDRIVERRARRQADAYAAELAAIDDLEGRARRLAELRTAEGYEAEVVESPDGDGVLLVEHHCPVCDAAATCQGLCRGELEAFRAAVGADAEVEREQHLLSGDDRCTYRIRPARRRARR
jgi:predicted ArsR family transcriptional regulator